MTPTSRPPPHDPARVGLYQSWRGLGGGMDYERDLEAALASAFPFAVRNVYPERFLALPGRRFRQIAAAIPDPGWSVTVRGFLPALALGIRRPRGRQIVLIHHLDHSAVPRRAVSGMLERLFRRALARADRIVAVAEYWRRELAGLAPELPVDVVFNGFDPGRYVVVPEARAAFRARHGFDGRPLVYLGNAQRAKGVVEAFEALRGRPWQFITSGRREVSLPCPHLEGSPEEYRTLLAAADLAIAFSRFREGWNRTAHEALLAGTPVVGLRRGGQGELLEGAGQIVVEGPAELGAAADAALARRDELAARGRAHAALFTRARFRDGWLRIVEAELDRAGR